MNETSGTTSARPRVLVTMGDPAGVGPEVALKALCDAELRACADAKLVGDAAAFEWWAGRLALPVPVEVVPVGARAGDIEPGRPGSDGALAALAAVEVAARLCMAGEADAMVTAPVSKSAISRAGRGFSGHTEFLADLTGAGGHVMTFVDGSRRVALATTHLALADVPSAITSDLVVGKLKVLDRGLREWFGIDSPAIGVAALNPHAGESGAFGDEEERVIRPAVALARAAGVDAEGPFPADSVFVGLGEPDAGGPGSRFDAVLAMYHDQGTIPAKLMGFGRAVNVTLGLPIVRTSVDHGTAFGLAGSGRADEGSMAAAIRLAAAVARRRAESA